MSGKSFGQEVKEELLRKAVIWGPPIAGGLLLGPVGIAVGIATMVAIAGSRSSGDGSAANASQSKETGSSS